MKANVRAKFSVKKASQQGVALVTVLLLLLLLTGMSVAMVLATSSDMIINGSYRNFRGSFYAADSGVNIARQAMLDQIKAAVPATFTATTQPIPTGTDATVQSYVLSTYGNSTVLNGGQSANSWPEKFKVTNPTLTLTSCTVTGGGGTCAAPLAATSYQYIYSYSLTSVGQSQGTEVATVFDRGFLFVNATVAAAAPSNVSFAGWGMFIDQYSICDGTSLVAGTLTGPTFTNGAWNFGNSGTYTFTDPVGSVSSQAGYQANNCVTGTTSGNGISPNFQAGFKLGQPAVPLPQNSYNQKEAVLDSVGTSGTNPTNAQMNAILKNVSGTAYPLLGTSSGVYLPYTVNVLTGAKTLTGGGIYVEGSANVTLSIPTTGNTTAQIYTIVQSGVTTTVTIDNVANTTTITSGATTTTLAGVPVQRDPTTDAVTRDATMLYVDGSINALTGPGQGQAGIQNDTALTIAANGNVTVTGDVLYKSEPVTFTQNQIAGTPADTLIPANNYGQVLGIFTATGNVNLQNGQANGNLEIDASVATISQSGSGGIVNTGNAINTLNIVGGRIQNTIQNINSTTRNVFFDRRFASGGFAPPWFPSTSVSAGNTDSATITTTVQRIQWLNQTPYQ